MRLPLAARPGRLLHHHPAHAQLRRRLGGRLRRIVHHAELDAGGVRARQARGVALPRSATRRRRTRRRQAPEGGVLLHHLHHLVVLVVVVTHVVVAATAPGLQVRRPQQVLPDVERRTLASAVVRRPQLLRLVILHVRVGLDVLQVQLLPGIKNLIVRGCCVKGECVEVRIQSDGLVPDREGQIIVHLLVLAVLKRERNGAGGRIGEDFQVVIVLGQRDGRQVGRRLVLRQVHQPGLRKCRFDLQQCIVAVLEQVAHLARVDADHAQQQLAREAERERRLRVDDGVN
mmetsp:Transcript_17837/g.46422  ORF Transcript_17837/g.46422 Transcript_17837/m.46422 type:complete len:287 (-) Transcript_17837:422-1282(-)